MEILIELPTPNLMLYIINTNVHTGYLLQFSWYHGNFFVCSGLFPLISMAAAALLALLKSYIYFSIYNNSMFIWLLGFVYQFKEWVISSKILV
jgi:hypothetical protein